MLHAQDTGVARRLAGVASSPVRDLLALTQQPHVVSFAGGLPAPELLDGEGLGRAFAEVLRGDRARRTLQYSTTEGDPELRALLAERLAARGVPTGADDVLVTSGSQQALTLAATVLLEPGDVVLAEEPSYLAALQAFHLAGARVVGVAGDEEGIHPDAIAAAAREHGAKALYVIPTFQNPTGRTLGAERRAALAEAVADLGLWLIEDDPYAEIRFEGEPLRPIAALDAAADRTLLLSSLSKIVAPGLRIGWARVPVSVRAAFVVAKQALDLHTSTVDQAAAAVYLASSDLAPRLDALRAAYRDRRDALLGELPATLPPGSVWTHPSGGMFTWARLPEGDDAEALLHRALEHDVAFVPGTTFYSGPPDRRTLRLAFTAAPPDELREGARRLAAACRT
jgi:DNA-binding transcriptional MocR family regulator